MTAPLKTAFWTVPLTLLALVGAAADVDAGELRATIHNVKPNQGRLMVALYDSEAARQADRPWAGQFLPSTGSELTVVFTGLPPGRYGVAVYQDRDGNGRLDTNLVGIPTEPYGFGMPGPAPRLPPSFDRFALTVAADGVVTTDVRMTP
ncbi:DUF2141 domain-containing protein [Azospirillum doebereinerae]|uniref:DUF2141 domain-containing protein n=1 Tax=Azospirillum doebereinerae TaxID=92933 RepID=A0A3S0X0W9_9PROT|nr:DUF2141 domain-containing protein [Azospirillum doebereinerae]RUQ74221.1 DUF2141 domain-containing protein [Azospirillum doebereinerae]